MKKLSGLLILLLTVFVLIGCQKNEIPNTWEEIEERGYIIVGLDDTFAPMGFRDNDGNLVGFDVDLAKAVGELLGVEVRFQPIDWDSKVLELNAGTIDMIWNGLTITESRLEEMSFSSAYLGNSQIIITKKDSTIDTVNDLIGKKVGVQISSASEDAVTASSIFTQLDEFVKYDTFNAALLELSNGTIDAVVIDEIMGRYVISQTDNLYQVATENFGVETYGVGFRLESTNIRDQINEALQTLVDNGLAAIISNDWFGENIILLS
ncbi:MAG: amino acid ABC transporter substrate-binding protein [Acholeplasmataceae bacterium]|nr:amino acid ABC transporter substrate-binding protein [Acholeplasmataceae bacterium]